MLNALSIVTALALAGLAVFTLLFLKRASRARQELAQSIHDQAHALNQRCDDLQGHLYLLEERQKIDHLLDLVAYGESSGQLTTATAGRLRGFALDLRSESLDIQWQAQRQS